MARRGWKKIFGITVLMLLVLVSLGITLTIGWRPFIGAKKRALTDRRFESPLCSGRHESCNHFFQTSVQN